MRALLHRLYEPVVEFALANRVADAGHAACCCWLSRWLAVRALGLEFLPQLEEGNFWIRATMPTSISLEAGNGYVNRCARS